MRRLAWTAIGGLWLTAAGSGLWVLWAYRNRPGVSADAPSVWPTHTGLERAPDRPDPDSSSRIRTARARARQLASLWKSSAAARPKTYVLFLRPRGFDAGWEQTNLWRAAARLPDVSVLLDHEGAIAGRLGSATSGQMLLYGIDGSLLFSGGITGARGHAGDNAGRAAVLAHLDRQASSHRHSRVRLLPVRRRREGGFAVIAWPATTATATGTDARTRELFAEYHHDIHERTDRLFAGLMALQWLAGIIFALWVSPLTWAGADSRTHLHVWAAVILGGIISPFPAALALLRPGRPATRYTIATAQMLMGALLIHLTGGRIETHFHVFGSLRSWPSTATGGCWCRRRSSSRSITCCAASSGRSRSTARRRQQWRWLEHAAWVVFEDIFLVMACRRS